jgi:hypothetical protein
MMDELADDAENANLANHNSQRILASNTPQNRKILPDF